ncbi:MAG: bifunctional DNA primase/polymerase [Pseudomonadota bacterium]
MSDTRYSTLAYRLVENGFGPIPLTHLKGTTVKWGGAQKVRMTALSVDHFANKAWFSPDKRAKVLGGNCDRVGLVHGPLYDYCSVDIDISEPDSAAAAMEVVKATLPETPLVRVGKAPKVLLIFQKDGDVHSVKPHPIEIFANSGQIAAFGMHPNTGRNYEWVTGASPLNTRADELPKVSQAGLNAFLETLKLEVPQPMDIDSEGRVVTAGDYSDFAEMVAERKIGGVQACIRQLENCTKGRNNTVMSVCAYLWAEGHNEDAIVRFVDRFFGGTRNDEFSDRKMESTVRSFVQRAEKKWDDGVAL